MLRGVLMTVDLRDQKTIDAIRAYVRIALGAGFGAIMLYLMLSGRVDPVAVLKALTSILAIGRVADGGLLMLSNRAKQE